MKEVEGEGSCLVFPRMRVTVRGIRDGLKALPLGKTCPRQLSYAGSATLLKRPSSFSQALEVSWSVGDPYWCVFATAISLENFSGLMHSTVCVDNYITGISRHITLSWTLGQTKLIKLLITWKDYKNWQNKSKVMCILLHITICLLRFLS